jgi:hypothetical protein
MPASIAAVLDRAGAAPTGAARPDPDDEIRTLDGDDDGQVPAAAPSRARTPAPAPRTTRPASPVPTSASAPAGPAPGAPEVATVKAEWRAAHPSARRWAERRGDPSRRRPSPARILFGLLLVALGAWLLLGFVPAHRPLGASELATAARQAVTGQPWRYPALSYRVARGLAVVLMTFGTLAALRGLAFRRRVEVDCQRCGVPVAADRAGLVLRCSEGRHRARLDLVAIGFAVGLVAIGGVLAVITALASLSSA